MAFFQPDRLFSRVSAISIEHDLIAQDLNAVLIDLDNTLRSRADGSLPLDGVRWIAALKEAGLACCLLTNNWHADVFEVARLLDLPIVAKALKPLPGGYLAAMNRLGAKARHTVVVGDQLFVDVVGAHLLGLSAYLVAPLAEEDLPHTLLLRRLSSRMIADPEPEPEPVGVSCK